MSDWVWQFSAYRLILLSSVVTSLPGGVTSSSAFVGSGLWAEGVFELLLEN